MIFFFFNQKTSYEMRISDLSSDVCSSDVHRHDAAEEHHERSDRADERPDAGIYEVIVMMFRTGHGVFPVFSSPGMTIPHRPPALVCLLFAAFARIFTLVYRVAGVAYGDFLDRTSVV